MKGIFDLKIPFSFSLNTKITVDKCDRLAYNEDVETIPHLTVVKSALFFFFEKIWYRNHKNKQGNFTVRLTPKIMCGRIRLCGNDTIEFYRICVSIC